MPRTGELLGPQSRLQLDAYQPRDSGEILTAPSIFPMATASHQRHAGRSWHREAAEVIMASGSTHPPVEPPSRRLLQRIRSEYDEMPGLKLTLPQAARFWHLDQATCESALESLVREGVLSHGRGGYVRAAG
jgi:hypothetical protein